jgi:ribosomal protein S10
MNVTISIVLKSFETLKNCDLGTKCENTKKVLSVQNQKRSVRLGLANSGGQMIPPKSNRSLRLPLKQSLYTVLRSPHIDKKSREQFELKVHKQLIIINTETKNLRDKLSRLKFHELPGVQMKVIFHYKTRLKSYI